MFLECLDLYINKTLLGIGIKFLDPNVLNGRNFVLNGRKTPKMRGIEGKLRSLVLPLTGKTRVNSLILGYLIPLWLAPS